MQMECNTPETHINYYALDTLIAVRYVIRSIMTGLALHSSYNYIYIIIVPDNHRYLIS